MVIVIVGLPNMLIACMFWNDYIKAVGETERNIYRFVQDFSSACHQKQWLVTVLEFNDHRMH